MRDFFGDFFFSYQSSRLEGPFQFDESNVPYHNFGDILWRLRFTKSEEKKTITNKDLDSWSMCLAMLRQTYRYVGNGQRTLRNRLTIPILIVILKASHVCNHNGLLCIFISLGQELPIFDNILWSFFSVSFRDVAIDVGC